MSDLNQQLQQEIQTFCKQNPQIDEVDIITTALTPKFWGKRYPIAKLASLLGQFKMPRGNFLMSPEGQYIEVLHYNDTDGDPDCAFQFIPGTLKPTPWAGEKRAQIMVSTVDAHTPFVAEPRLVLKNVLDKLSRDNMRPTVAFELEFYLIDKQRTEDGLAQRPKNQVNGRRDNDFILGMDRLDEFTHVLRDIRESCDKQGIISTAISAEMGPGQFEINLNHNSDCLKAADEVVLYQRLIKGVATKHGFEATFMAKPYMQYAGSGMHMHISLYDENGENQFAKNNNEMLRHAIGGCLQTLHGALAFLASTPNAYRRYAPDLAIATKKSWAFENRYAAIRIPESNEKNMRIEHRVPAADANPYLAMAAVLAGVYLGIKQKIDPGAECESQAAVEHEFPRTLTETLNELEQDKALCEILGEEFSEIYLAYKRSEIREFENHIAAREYQWYL